MPAAPPQPHHLRTPPELPCHPALLAPLFPSPSHPLALPGPVPLGHPLIPRPLFLSPPGLEDQLLGKLILKEKHELEEQRQALLEEVQSYKKKIKQLEDDLLFRWDD